MDNYYRQFCQAFRPNIKKIKTKNHFKVFIDFIFIGFLI